MRAPVIAGLRTHKEERYVDQRRINMTDLVRGEPLPWDVYDDASRLLLRKGYIVEHNKQIEALVERGLFVDAKALQREPDAAPAKPRQETPSVLRLISSCGATRPVCSVGHGVPDLQDPACR